MSERKLQAWKRVRNPITAPSGDVPGERGDCEERGVLRAVDAYGLGVSYGLGAWNEQDADRVELLLSPAVCAGLLAAPETRRLAFACIYFLLFLSHVIFCH